MSSLSKVPGVSIDPGNAESFVYEEAAEGESGLLAGSASGKPASDGPQYSEGEVLRLVASAKAEGIREGEERARADVGQTTEQERKRVTEALARFQSERVSYYSKVEVEVVHLALAIAAKILHRESQVDRMVVAGLVRVALEHLQQNTNIRLRIPPGETTAWQNGLHDIVNLTITEDPSLGRGDCVLETDIGSAHMGLDAQLKEVEQGFFDLLARRPPAQ